MTQREFEDVENKMIKGACYIFIAGIVVGVLFCIASVGIMFVYGNLRLS